MKHLENEELATLAEDWLSTLHLPHQDHEFMKVLAERIRHLAHPAGTDPAMIPILSAQRVISLLEAMRDAYSCDGHRCQGWSECITYAQRIVRERAMKTLDEQMRGPDYLSEIDNLHIALCQIVPLLDRRSDADLADATRIARVALNRAYSEVAALHEESQGQHPTDRLP